MPEILRQNYRRAYLGGTFDCFHVGHLNLIRGASEIAREVVVSLNTDDFAARYKRKPVMCLADRMAIVAACRYVTRVVVNIGGEDSRSAIVAAQPDVLVHGDDWTGAAYLKQLNVTEDWLRLHGIEVAYLPYTPGISTTAVLARAGAKE